MKIADLYTKFLEEIEKNRQNLKKTFKSFPDVAYLYKMAKEWGEDIDNIERWMKSAEYSSHKGVALAFISSAPKFLKKIEITLGETLQGELRMSPSLMTFDGFARYELGRHTVWFGIDHPDAD